MARGRVLELQQLHFLNTIINLTCYAGIKTTTMKKNLFAYQQQRPNLVPLLLLAAIILSLQSCCFLGPLGFASQKPCNCKPAYVADASNSVATHTGVQPVTNLTGRGSFSGNSTSLTETTQNTPRLPVDEGDVVVDNIAHDMMLTAPLPAQTDNSPISTSGQQRNTISSSNGGKQFAEKKMPLGIKAIQSYVTAGPNLSFKSSKENYGGTNHKSKPGVGVQFGFGTSYYFSEKFAVAPSLLFKNNNATETISYGTTGEPTYGGGGGGTSQEYETKYSYSYISVPVLAEIKLSEQFTVMAGPEVNLLVSAHTKLKSGSSDEKTDIKSSSVKTGVGAQVGVKYTIPNTPVGIQLLYDHRISRLNKKGSDDYGGSYETPAWNMKSIQLGVTCALCELLKGRQK